MEYKKMEKLRLLILVFSLGLLVGLTGCEQKSGKAKNSNEATEFFKEIENVPVVENADISSGETQDQSTAKVQTMPSGAIEAGQQTPAAMEKPTVQDIQQALGNAHFYQGKIDGVLGPKTKQGVEDFQAQNNLKVDGKVGPKTWQKLKTYLSPPAAEGSVAAGSPEPSIKSPAASASSAND